MIGPNLVLTVAHNIHYRLKNSTSAIKFNDFTFYPGQSSDSEYKYGYSVEEYKFSDIFEQSSFNLSKNIRYDYALMKLDQNVKRDRYITVGVN